MPTLVLATGFEHGTTAGLATGNAGRRYADSVSTPSIITTTPKNGTYCLELTATSAIRNLTWDSNTIGASQTHLVAGFWLRFPTSLPAGDVVIAAVQSNSTHDAILLYRTSGTKLTVQLDGTNDIGTFTVVADTWYWIDLHADFTGATSTFDWSVNGTAQTQATVSQTTTVFTFLLGWAASTTATVDYDDVVASVTGADYPLGQHQVVLLKPDTGGTATESGTANATSTFTANGTVGTTFNSANLLSRTSEVPPTIGSTADGFAQRTSGATNWANIPMTSYTLQAGESVSGLRAEVVGWSASALANNIGFRAFNGTTEETFFAAADPNFDNSTTTPAWICEMLTLANYDTQSELDALILRAGFSTDVSPVPGAHALYVEVAVKLAASGDATVTAVMATATADALVPTVSGDAAVTAVQADATADALAPAVTVDMTIAAEMATATADALPPTIISDAVITAVIATATADAPAPTITGDATVTAIQATAVADALPPAVSGGAGGDATVAAPTAAATANALVPTVTSDATIIVPAPAAATADALPPTATADALVLAITAEATAAALLPIITGGSAADIFPGYGTATVGGTPGTVTANPPSGTARAAATVGHVIAGVTIGAVQILDAGGNVIVG